MRNGSIGDDTVELNEGIGEGVSYRSVLNKYNHGGGKLVIDEELAPQPPSVDGVRGRVYMELAVEILSGGSGSESKLSRMVKPLKDAKAGKGGGKDGKTPAGGGGGGAGAAAGGAADDDKGKAAAAEVLPVESPPAVI